jgi:pimeloyl-ACP methyl ester carboxylesterase
MACERDVTMRAMDLPGHGKSPQPEKPEAAADVSVAWAREVIQDPVHLFGHSFGAYVALRLAVECPDKVLSLSLYEPVFFAGAKAINPEAHAANLERMAGLDALLKAGDPEAAARQFTEVWGDGRPWEMLPARARQMMADGMPMVLAANGALIEDDAGILPRLSEIKVPTLLMDGALSPEVVGAVQDGLAAQIQGAQRKTLEGAGHMGVLSHPSEVARAFLAHIAR